MASLRTCCLAGGAGPFSSCYQGRRSGQNPQCTRVVSGEFVSALLGRGVYSYPTEMDAGTAVHLSADQTIQQYCPGPLLCIMPCTTTIHAAYEGPVAS